MTEAIKPVSIYKPAFSSNNNITSAVKIPESPQDKLELSKKNLNNLNTEEKKSFSEKFGLDIAAFTTGIAGIGAALKMGKINKQLNQKAVLILESVGVKSSPLKSFFKRNIDNLEKIENVLVKDKLTGLFNRRYLDAYLKKAFEKAKKDGTELDVFMFDIDRFKMVNTALGHDGGDAVLKQSSEAVSKVVEKYEKQGLKVIFARYGGEEFTLVVEGAPKAKAKEIAEEIRETVNKNKDLKDHAEKFVEFYKKSADELRLRGEQNLKPEEVHLLHDYDFLHKHVRDNNGFTISAGLCSLKDHAGIIDAPFDSIKMADLALEHAKNAGRNQLAEVDKTGLEEYAAYKLKNDSTQ